MPAKKKPKRPTRAIEGDLKPLDAMSDEDIVHLDASVPDLDDWVSHAQKLSGPPIKTSVTMRLDASVVEYFKDQGPGYQTRVNGLLRAYVALQQGKRQKPKGR